MLKDGILFSMTSVLEDVSERVTSFLYSIKNMGNLYLTTRDEILPYNVPREIVRVSYVEIPYQILCSFQLIEST